MRLIIVSLVLLLFSPQHLHANPTINLLVKKTREIDFNALPDFRAISTLLAVSKNLSIVKENQLAEEFFQEAISIAEQDEKRRYHRLLFKHAIAIDRIELAKQFANESLASKNSLLDQLDVERYRRGNKAAIENYPREKQTFYNALRLATAMVEAGDYEQAEDYVTDIKISEENDPRAVTSMTFRAIAEKYREAGDMKNALIWMDKAFAVGGRLYFTGYSLEISHRSMHGTLKENLKEFAQRGANHPGNNGRELVQLLVHELLESGLFQEAIECAQLLEKKDDVEHSLSAIATQQAQQGEIGGAYETVLMIQNPEIKGVARVLLAHVLLDRGELNSAKSLVDYTRARFSDEEKIQQRYYLIKLAGFYTRINDLEKLEEILSFNKNENEQCFILVAAFEGLAESQTN